MIFKKNKHIVKTIIATLFVSALLFTNNSYALSSNSEYLTKVSGAENSYVCKAPKAIVAKTLSENSEDYAYSSSNLVCLFWALESGIVGASASLPANSICVMPDPKTVENLSKWKKTLKVLKKSKDAVVSLVASGAFSVVDPIINAHVMSSIQTAHCAFAVIRQPAIAGACCTATTVATAAIEGAPWGTLALLKNKSQDALEYTRVCGYDWYNYYYNENDSVNNYPIIGSYEGSYSYRIKDCLLNDNCSNLDGATSSWNINNKIFREYIYGGKEFKSSACTDPRKDELRGFSGNAQRYYMKGTEAGNYACYARFGSHLFGKDICKNTTGTECDAELQSAYECCTDQSQSTICLTREQNPGTQIAKSIDSTFCEKGKQCNLESDNIVPIPFYSGKEIAYETYVNPDYPSMLCAKTYSACPYNHNVFRGTQEPEEYDCTYSESSDSWSGNDCGVVILSDNTTTSSYGEAKNFCQLNANCVNLSYESTPSKSTMPSKFFSDACQDFRGDSLNYTYRMAEEGSASDFWSSFISEQEEPYKTYVSSTYSLINERGLSIDNEADIDAIIEIAYDASYNNAEFVSYLSNAITEYSANKLVNSSDIDEFLGFRGFTAPVVQCVKESLENLFFNLEGYNACNDTLGIEMDSDGNCNCLDGDRLNSDGLCISGNKTTYDPYMYKKGRVSTTQVSPFEYIQKTLRNLVRLILILSITFLGLRVVLFGAESKNLDFKKTLLFLLKFSLVYFFAVGTAWQSYFAKNVINISHDVSSIVYESFNPKVLDSGEINESLVDYSNQKYDGCYFDQNAYPEGSEYLAIWDTFDCKIAKYIGFGPSVSLPSVIVLITLVLFLGPLGILFATISLSFAIFTILIAVKTVIIFLMSVFAIIMFIFISPIIIPLVLFEQTKSIFNGWLSSLISVIIQPIILFTYIGIFLSITEPILLGSATFTGEVKGGRELVCNSDAQVDSLLCLFGNYNDTSFGSSITEYSGLKPLGVTLKTIGGAFDGESGNKTFSQLLTIFKGLLIIYLFYMVLDQIPSVASNISGGRTVKIDSKVTGFDEAMSKTIKGSQAATKVAQEATRTGVSTVAGTAIGVGEGTITTGRAIGRGARKVGQTIGKVFQRKKEE